MKFWVFIQNLSRRFDFHQNMTRLTGTLHRNLCTFMIISPPEFILEYETYRPKLQRKLNTHLVLHYSVPPGKSWSWWDNVAQYCTAGQDTHDNTMRRMRSTCWIAKVTNTHSNYVILLAFPLQERLHVAPYCYVDLLRSRPLTYWADRASFAHYTLF